LFLTKQNSSPEPSSSSTADRAAVPLEREGCDAVEPDIVALPKSEGSLKERRRRRIMVLEGKVAMVTGAARGLGKVLASSLAEEGALVAVSDIMDAVEETADEVRNSGHTSVAVKMDVGDYDSVKRGFAKAVESLGPVDILINNAAITDNMALAHKMDKAKWEREIAVNLSGAFYCIQQVLEPMIDRKWGRIINIVSGAGLLGGFGQTSYSSSKAGLIGLARSVALETARHGITANCINPGLMGTPAFWGLDEKIRERLLRTVPMRRPSDPKNVGNMAVFLCSDKASYITGVVYEVAGGQGLATY
jgi:3-oxoacyl-[acyl-carrier protein] reductase